MSVSALPVSGVLARLREPTGRDELIALDQATPPVTTLLALARSLVHDEDGGAIAFESLPAVDLAALALLIRREWLGERVHADALCSASGCGEPIDVTFAISDYLDHHRPRRFRGLRDAGEGWLELTGSDVRFRIPTVEDLLAASGEQRDAAWLKARCIRPAGAGRDVVRRVERALDAIAPRLDNHVTGGCPECGATVELFFDPIAYLLEELRNVCAGLYADVHELAFAYRWSEASILAIDRRRRHAYVAMVRGELALA